MYEVVVVVVVVVEVVVVVVVYIIYYLVKVNSDQGTSPGRRRSAAAPRSISAAYLYI